MGFFNKLFGGGSNGSGSKSSAPAFEGKAKSIMAPLSGKVCELSGIPDEIFASGTMGPGCGIDPDGDTVYAPFDGTVTFVAETLHAVSLESNDGAEILIHVGLDTVDMNGKGFKPLAKADQVVKAGTPLLKFDRAAISAAGHPAVTAVIVTNGDDLPSLKLETTGPVKEGTLLFTF